MKKIELLAPAKNYETGVAALNCGADAVYIGGERFGARSAAGNTLADIEKLLSCAHRYHARVYATVNTILYENELEDARAFIIKLYNSGIDGVIFQDMGLLEMDLPPVPLHLSTQCDNYDIEKIKFFDKMGIPRVVLARELSIDEVKKIRDSVECELEYFIHGALCVSMSGRCYMSAAIGGRSANRGECAQPCRRSYILTDRSGKIIPAGKYPLSLKDLNRAEYIGELIDAGVDSFKIEGRLKGVNYVKNIVAYYRREVDRVLEGKPGLVKSSSGISVPGFAPDPYKTFNRGYTGYFSMGRTGKILSPHTPKSLGKRIGVISEVERNMFCINTGESLANGDGLFFFKPDGAETGMRVNRIDGRYVYPFSLEGIYKGAEIFRNHDAVFEKRLETAKSERRITVDIRFDEIDEGYKLTMTDSDSCTSVESVSCVKEKALKDGTVNQQVDRQLRKLGNTIFKAGTVDISLSQNRFIPVSLINDMRRNCVENLEAERLKIHYITPCEIIKSDIKYPFDEIDYSWNVSNSLANRFYERHGVRKITEAFETGPRTGNEALMTTKMCLKYENGFCPKYGGHISGFSEPYFLNDGVNRFKLSFDCSRCVMLIQSCN